MQAKRKTQPYDTFEPLFDGSCEVPIDMEYDMPDYCADIQKNTQVPGGARALLLRGQRGRPALRRGV